VYPRLKIILLSVDANDKAAAKSVGADLVYKGVTPNELLTVLKPILMRQFNQGNSTEQVA